MNTKNIKKLKKNIVRVVLELLVPKSGKSHSSFESAYDNSKEFIEMECDLYDHIKENYKKKSGKKIIIPLKTYVK